MADLNSVRKKAVTTTLLLIDLNLFPTNNRQSHVIIIK